MSREQKGEMVPPKKYTPPKDSNNKCPNCKKIFDKNELKNHDEEKSYSGVLRLYFCPNCEAQIGQEWETEPEPPIDTHHYNQLTKSIDER